MLGFDCWQAEGESITIASEEIVISGRKLLIADDSVTIQKVVHLTFSDEGMLVTSVGGGDEALARLEEFAPDVVLADVFMPGLSGYEVCAAIKHSERFRHIPVMLLVGSFEPFDEAEARRVGADDVLTKPFQSIRQLVNRVGTLLGGKDAERDETNAEAPASELATLGHEGQLAEDRHEASDSQVDGELNGGVAEEALAKQSSDEMMSTAEIELTTADTLPLVELESEKSHDVLRAGIAGDSAPDAATLVESGNIASDQDRAYWAARLANESEPATQKQESKHQLRVEPMEKSSEQRRANTNADEFDDLLLDLGDMDSVPVPGALDDSVLDLEDEAVEPASATWEQQGFGSPAISQADSLHGIPDATEAEPAWIEPSHPQSASTEQDLGAAWAIVAAPAPFERVTDEDSNAALREQAVLYKQQASYEDSAPTQAADGGWTDGAQAGAPGARLESASPPSGNRLSPEDIDAIARRVVEHLSERAVREIAWEVVPELAELMIKRRLDEEK